MVTYLRRFWLGLTLIVTCHSLSHASTLLDELNINVPRPSSPRFAPKLSLANQPLPLDITVVVAHYFSTNFNFLRATVALNHEFNTWAQPKLLTYARTFTEVQAQYQIKDIEPNIFKTIIVHQLFMGERIKVNPQQRLKVYKALRQVIETSVKKDIFPQGDDDTCPLIEDNCPRSYDYNYDKDTQTQSLKDIHKKFIKESIYDCPDELFDQPKLIRAAAEMQRYRSGVYLSHMLWEARHYLERTAEEIFYNKGQHYTVKDIDSSIPYQFKEWILDSSSMNKALYKHKIYYYDEYEHTEDYRYSNPNSCLNDLLYAAHKHKEFYPDSKSSLAPIVRQVVECSKHLLHHIQAHYKLYGDPNDKSYDDSSVFGTVHFYDSCLDDRTLRHMQKIPMNKKFTTYSWETDHSEVQKTVDLKIETLRSMTLDFAVQHVEAAEVYTRMIRHLLQLG